MPTDPVTDEPPAKAGKRSVREVLAAAVEALGGQERSGQIEMAEAVADAMKLVHDRARSRRE